MKMQIKLFACAILAVFVLLGCDPSPNPDDDTLGTRDETSSKQSEDNSGLSVPPPANGGGDVGGGDPMPPEYVKPEPTPQPPANYKPDTTYVKEPEKEPPQPQPIDPPKPVTWSDEVEKWVRAQYQIDPKEQEQREVWILDGTSVRAKLVLTVDGIRRLEGGYHVIFPEEYVDVK